MFKITGLDKLQRELQEAKEAFQGLDGELGTVSFDPYDPGSIEAAISAAGRMIDERVASYTSNAIIGPMIGDMKEKYRESIIEKAAAARLGGGDSE